MASQEPPLDRFLSLRPFELSRLRVISVAKRPARKAVGEGQSTPRVSERTNWAGGGTCLYHQRRERQEICLCLSNK